MKITADAPGWEQFQPFPEEHPEITCDIKRLSFGEQLNVQKELTAELDENEDGKTIQFASPFGMSLFRLHVQAIEGLEINGKRITRPEEILDPATPTCPILGRFYMACLEQFVELNILREDEAKKSETLSSTSGHEASGDSVQKEASSG